MTTPEQRQVLALQERGRFGIRLGLGRTRALLRLMGSPHRELRGALIGGTNGKGSVQALVGAALREAGLRVGQTPKPHLSSYRERILVDGSPIDPDAFAELIAETLRVADRVPARLGPPTEFELVTAAAFSWFARQKVEAAVIEVGLGGRLDATNAWDGGVAAITTVALDHTEHLGRTEVEIATQKAAIIKRGDRAVSGVTGPAANPIRARARRLRVPLTEITPLHVLAMDREGLLLDGAALGPLRVGLLGRHQAHNAAVALAVLEALREAGIADVSADAIGRGFSVARWPGRLELLRVDPADPDVILDGAHNQQGMNALAAALDELRPLLSPGRPSALIAVMADKDIEALLEEALRSDVLRNARVIATTVPGSTRSLGADALAAAWRAADPRQDVTAVPDADAALAAARQASRAENGPLVIFGSLYLVGWVRTRLLTP